MGNTEATVKRKQQLNVQSIGVEFSAVFCFVLFLFFGLCCFSVVVWSVLFKWARNRYAAGIKVKQTRRHKSNIVFTDQGTCISFSKRYLFTIPFFISQYIVHLVTK